MSAPQDPLPGGSGGVCIFGPHPRLTCGTAGESVCHVPNCWCAFWPLSISCRDTIRSLRMGCCSGAFLSELELSSVQPSSVPGIIDMCTGSAFAIQVLGGQLQPISVGREIAGYHWTSAGIHMHEARGPASLAELSITFRRTNFRELATRHPHLPQPPCCRRSAGTKEAKPLGLPTSNLCSPGV